MDKPEQLPIYKIVLTEDEMGAEYVALVDEPAIRLNWISFREENVFKFTATDIEKKIICGPLMIPDSPIYRYSESKGEHMVVFDKQTIEQIRERFFKNKNTSNVNLMHDPKQVVEGVYMIESYIVDKTKGMNAPEIFKEVPEGTWMASYKVDNPEVWAKVKSGEFKGFSIEGTFGRELDDSSALAEFESNIRELDKDGTLNEYFYLMLRNKNMKTITNLLNELKEKFADIPEVLPETLPVVEEIKAMDVKTSDGKMLTVDGESLMVGHAVRMGDAICPDGIYILEDGTSLSIVEGKIAEIVSKVETPVEDVIETRMVALESAIADLKNIQKQNTFNFNSNKETLASMMEAIEILSGQPKVKAEPKEIFTKSNLKQTRLELIAQSLSKKN